MCDSGPLPPTFPDLPHAPGGRCGALTLPVPDNQDLEHHPHPTQSASSCLRTSNPIPLGLPGARTHFLFLLLEDWSSQRPPLYSQALALGGSYSQPPRLHLGLGEESGGPAGALRPERVPPLEGHSLSLAVPPSLAQERQGQQECWLWHRRLEWGPHRGMLGAAGEEHPLHSASGSLRQGGRQGAEGAHRPGEKCRPKGVSRPLQDTHLWKPTPTHVCVTQGRAGF